MEPDPEKLNEEKGRIAAKARDSVKYCLTPFKKKYWNSGSAEIGFLGTKSTTSEDSNNGSGYWLGISYGIGSLSQIVLSASYQADKQLNAAEDGSIPTGDEVEIGARMRFGSEKGTIMFETLYSDIDLTEGSESFSRANIGIEFMVMRDIWIQLAAGKAFSTDLFDDDINYSGQIRFGFSETSILSNIGK